MRQKNRIAALYSLAAGIMLMLTGILALSSCHKEANDKPTTDEMQEATGLLKGQLLSGKLENVVTEDNVAYLDFNKGSKGILVQLAAGEKAIHIPSLENASVITSQHGIIIKDPLTNNILLLPQNDTESIRKFQEVGKLFKEHKQQALIAGTTLLNFNS